MIDTFYIGAYWNGPKETPDEVCEKTVSILKSLKEIDQLYSNFFELCMSRKSALENSGLRG